MNGANEDSQRIAAMVTNNMEGIDEIYVTLDSHHRNHIAHAVFWTNARGERPAPFSEITHAMVASGEWVPKDPQYLEHAKFYTAELERLNRFTLRIWPEHCLIGTTGHSVVPVLNEALQAWVEQKNKSIHYVHKGQNCLTEMYSAIAADVPMPDDPATCKNPALMAELTSAGKLIVCGEAKSHCVNFTLRDILVDWRAAGRDPAQIHLLLDGCSTVAGCDALAEGFESDMRAAGVSCSTTANVMAK